MVITAFLLAIPVVDIDNTIFVQGGIYLLLVAVLNPLLFKPWLAAQARRTTAIDGAFEKAAKLREDAETLGAQYDEKLAAARDRALELRSMARRQEEATQADKLAGVRQETTAHLEKERARLGKEATDARAALSGRVDELAREIASKVLGRAP
jgi:F-type H+-transporting ATPase subunit b